MTTATTRRQTAFEWRNDGTPEGRWYAPRVDPNDVTPHTINLVDVIGKTDAIAACSYSATNATIDTGLSDFDGYKVTIWSKLHVAGETARISFTATTTSGRVVDRSFYVECSDL